MNPQQTFNASEVAALMALVTEANRAATLRVPVESNTRRARTGRAVARWIGRRSVRVA